MRCKTVIKEHTLITINFYYLLCDIHIHSDSNSDNNKWKRRTHTLHSNVYLLMFLDRFGCFFFFLFICSLSAFCCMCCYAASLQANDSCHYPLGLHIQHQQSHCWAFILWCVFALSFYICESVVSV